MPFELYVTNDAHFNKIYGDEGLTDKQSLGPRGMDKMVSTSRSTYLNEILTPFKIQTPKGNTIIVRNSMFISP